MLTRNDWSYDEHVNSVEEPLEKNVFWAKVDQFNTIMNLNDRADSKLAELSEELGV